MIYEKPECIQVSNIEVGNEFMNTKVMRGRPFGPPEILEACKCAINIYDYNKLIKSKVLLSKLLYDL